MLIISVWPLFSDQPVRRCSVELNTWSVGWNTRKSSKLIQSERWATCRLAFLTSSTTKTPMNCRNSIDSRHYFSNVTTHLPRRHRPRKLQTPSAKYPPHRRPFLVRAPAHRQVNGMQTPDIKPTRHHRWQSAVTERIRWKKTPNCSPTKPKSNNTKSAKNDAYFITNLLNCCLIIWFSRKATYPILYKFSQDANNRGIYEKNTMTKMMSSLILKYILYVNVLFLEP